MLSCLLLAQKIKGDRFIYQGINYHDKLITGLAEQKKMA